MKSARLVLEVAISARLAQTEQIVPSDHPVCVFRTLFPHRPIEFTNNTYGAVVPEIRGRSPLYLIFPSPPTWTAASVPVPK